MFPSVIPLSGTDCSRVTHPSAARTALSKLSTVPARLACVRHAASVRPEPGSNSYVQSFTILTFALAPARTVVSLRNLTVSVRSRSGFRLPGLRELSFLSVLSSLYRFQGSLTAALATTCDSIAKTPRFVNTFFEQILNNSSSYYIHR